MRTLSLKHWALVSAPLLLVLIAIWVGFGSEREVALFFKDHRAAHPALKLGMKLLTDWSNPLFYAVYAIMLFTAWRSGNRDRLRFVLILLAVQAVVAGLAVHLLKMIIGRPRPGEGELFSPIGTKAAYQSLPSGHTAEITGWTLPLALRVGSYAVSLLLGLFLAGVGFSRIYLGWHHPTDVFFGWLLGCVSGIATTVIARSALFRRS
ncbi:MAG: phosphatase PAP2 family protein [Pseudodesulfovibrio sp.]|jgi:undecaprenyl-diphosphatase|uniref:PA-phosphatase n=1 Tax=Pseudodesulfovibrio indicus TaxID=1716143 RepID=A0A126QQW2_9BACT|nr:phosphatase PAP2 family protein [Pseudodesulfovibrio indicus]AMK12371.1 PA-phosphatase [Pseudodesulfovibrio indicus]TDT90661.1 undecaprenyl-diphosphatase [Pseudodesulfovibrio indicus]